jgi:hypothetical protein
MMSEIVNDLLLRSCCHLFSKSGSSNIKYLAFIASCLARGGLRRFAERSSETRAAFLIGDWLKYPG